MAFIYLSMPCCETNFVCMYAAYPVFLVVLLVMYIGSILNISIHFNMDFYSVLYFNFDSTQQKKVVK